MTLAGCAQKEYLLSAESEKEVPLELHVTTYSPATRGLIRENVMPDGSVLGLAITEDGMETYDGKSVMNIAYASTSVDGCQVWDAVNEKLLLSNTSGKVYGYYPYSEEVTTLKEIPVKASSGHQIDYMYSNPFNGVRKVSPVVNLTLKHALSAVTLTITRGTYEGPGVITSASIKGDALAGSAILNALDGSLSSIGDVGIGLSPEFDPLTVSSTQSKIDIISVPSGRKSAIEVELCIDGKISRFSTEEMDLRQGYINNLNITIDKGSAFITSTDVSEWIHDSASNRLEVGDHSVIFGGDTDGLSFHNSVDKDGNVTIIAAPHYREYTEVRPVTITGDATMQQTLDEGTGNMMITITDIRSDVTVNFNSHYFWIQAEFQIDDVSAEHKMVGTFYSGSGLDRIRVNGVDIGVVEYYQFPEPGTYKVEYACTTSKIVRNSLFYGMSDMVSVIIPEGMDRIDAWAFSSCKDLQEISIPLTMKSISYQVFENCSSLKSISIPDGCVISYGLLSRCSRLTYAKLPSDLTLIPEMTFQYCSSLSHFDMPPGITRIGNDAFNSTAFESFEFPDAVTAIESSVLRSCPNLKEVRFPAGLTRIGTQAFAFCNALERVILSDGTVCEGEFVIPEGVTEIDALALYFDAPAIRSICLPSTLVDIEVKGLINRTIEEYTLKQAHPKYDIRNYSVVESTTNTLIATPVTGGKIHDSVTAIGNSVFYENIAALVDIPAGVTEIHDEAFSSFRGKTIISRALTPPTLGEDSFLIATYRGTLKVPAESMDLYNEQWMVDELGYLGYQTMRWNIVALAEGE